MCFLIGGDSAGVAAGGGGVVVSKKVVPMSKVLKLQNQEAAVS